MPSNVANLSRSVLWYHAPENKLFTGVAGQPASYAWNNTPAQPFGLWSYGVKDGTGDSVLEANSDGLRGLTRPDQALCGSTGDIGFCLDGTDQYGTRIGGFMQVDLDQKTASNSSISALYGSRIYHGSIQYVPVYSIEGINIAMGGQYFGDQWADMSIMHVYDPVSKTFHNQTATGDIPDGRADYCTAGAASTTDTYEIFYYGGFRGVVSDSATKYDTIHILTLPAFRWIKVSYPASSPRSSHTCNNFNNTARIISLGGTDASAPMDDLNSTAKTLMTRPDQRKQGLGVFDLTSLTWTDKFSPSAPRYVQSDPVAQYYAMAGK